jgi:hypothetical protein
VIFHRRAGGLAPLDGTAPGMEAAFGLGRERYWVALGAAQLP